MKAWHFLQDDRRLRWDWKRVVKPGKVYRVNPNKLKLCQYGLHASIKPLDALIYAPGSIICRVELSGKILSAEDKLCAEKRKVLWIADATKCLHLFAIRCAKKALLAERMHGREPDPRSFMALTMKMKWLDGKVSDDELNAARSAAWSAAKSAAESAAESAAWFAARSAAWSAAWSAAKSAAESAAWSIARSKQNNQLYRMFMALEREE